MNNENGLDKNIKKLKDKLKPPSLLFFEYLRKRKGKEGNAGEQYGPWYIRPKAGGCLELNNQVTVETVEEVNIKIKKYIDPILDVYRQNLKDSLEGFNYKQAISMLDKIEEASQDVLTIQTDTENHPERVGFNEAWALQISENNTEEEVQLHIHELSNYLDPIHCAAMQDIIHEYNKMTKLHPKHIKV